VSSGPNLFARLHKWAAVKGQEENFFTESLAIVLQHLLIHAREAGVRLVSRLTGELIHLSPNEADTIEIKPQPQIEAEKKKPDLEFRTLHRLAWIEVKVDNKLQQGQLKNYLDLLKKSGYEHTRMVLLTLKKEEVSEEEARHVLKFRWFDFGDWLENELRVISGVSKVAGFLAWQFLDFLRERNMIINQVGWYMPEGTRALSNFLNMLLKALADCELKVPKNTLNATLDYSGFYANHDGREYWIGLHHATPEKLQFLTLSSLNNESAALRGIELENNKDAKNGFSWRNFLELTSEPVHFFERSKVSQIRCLESFLGECLKVAHSIETPDQPPIPEEPEES
jgi:hypothetical protein